MKRFLFLAAATLLSLAQPRTSAASTWEIDAGHSVAAFSVRHLMVSNVRGELGKVTGTLHLDDQDITKSTVEATIDVSTINTRDEKRDGHLKSPDFFDVAHFPTITFKSKRVQKVSADQLKVTGALTIHGVTQEVTLTVNGLAAPVKDPWGNTKSGATATVVLSRKDFGMTWNKALETGGMVVSNDVNVTLEIELLKK